MTAQVETRENSYVGDGTDGPFAYTFTINDASWLKVYVNGVISTDYTLDETLKEITFLGGSEPAVGVIVLLRSEIEATQDLNLIEYGPFPAEAQEDALDKLTYLIQELNLTVNNSSPFTPGIKGSSVEGSPTITATGWSIKIADIVFAYWYIDCVALGGMDGNISITDFPYPVNVTQFGIVTLQEGLSIAISDSYNVILQHLDSNPTEGFLSYSYETGAISLPITAAMLNDNCAFSGISIYKTT